jgi:phosphomethylpyrimidine synthase
MKITQEVRDYAAAKEANATQAEIEAGMAAKSAEFRAAGSEIYIPLHKA